MVYGDYGEFGYGGGDYGSSNGVLVQSAELLSLFLIFASFLIIAYLALRTRTVRSFQFEMFVFSLILVVAEVPRVFQEIGYLDLSAIAEFGLGIHTASMVALALFVAYRSYRFFKG